MPRTVFADAVKSAPLALFRTIILTAAGFAVAALAWDAALQSLCGLRTMLLSGASL